MYKNIGLLLLLLQACGFEQKPEYLPEPELFVAEVRVWGGFESAIGLLHMVGYELVQAETPQDAQVIIYPHGPACDGHKLGYVSNCGGVWLCGTPTPQLLAHEIGHTLGARHIEGPAIMQAYGIGPMQMTELDAVSFRELGLSGSIFSKECER